MTVKYTLEKRPDEFKDVPFSTIPWLTDSINMVAFLNKGSSKRHTMPDILQVHKKVREYNLRIIPLQVSREDYRIQEANQGTRFFDPDDWAIDVPSFEKLVVSWPISIDLFAHFTNAKCQRFFSYGKAPHSLGVDAFSQSWRQVRLGMPANQSGDRYLEKN